MPGGIADRRDGVAQRADALGHRPARIGEGPDDGGGHGPGQIAPLACRHAGGIHQGGGPVDEAGQGPAQRGGIGAFEGLPALGEGGIELAEGADGVGGAFGPVAGDGGGGVGEEALAVRVGGGRVMGERGVLGGIGLMQQGGDRRRVLADEGIGLVEAPGALLGAIGGDEGLPVGRRPVEPAGERGVGEALLQPGDIGPGGGLLLGLVRLPVERELLALRRGEGVDAGIDRPFVHHERQDGPVLGRERHPEFGEASAGGIVAMAALPGGGLQGLLRRRPLRCARRRRHARLVGLLRLQHAEGRGQEPRTGAHLVGHIRDRPAEGGLLIGAAPLQLHAGGGEGGAVAVLREQAGINVAIGGGDGLEEIVVRLGAAGHDGVVEAGGLRRHAGAGLLQGLVLGEAVALEGDLVVEIGLLLLARQPAGGDVADGLAELLQRLGGVVIGLDLRRGGHGKALLRHVIGKTGQGLLQTKARR
ncbi:hypothetical protein [Labrys monachus]|uniref:Uncharacterized protein n=1 Tax=Labrys monachus TaxID=217067 RepID=A0ABU0FLA5_9HYPH|nr:hypothetical protein [Labrys monachus]MDQ0395394.1 hypothetical protein [Labrys monachus]